MRYFLLGLAALAGLALIGPGRADDKPASATTPVANAFDKYLPDNSKFYVHVAVPKLFNSELVRKALPMAFDKYANEIVQLAGMAKGLPNVPPIDDDQIKQGLKMMADPQFIGQVFDAAKDAVTDLVIAGNPEGGEKADLVILIKCEAIKSEMVDQMAQMIGGVAAGQLTVDTDKTAKGNIYSLSSPQQPGMKMHITVPANGILQLASSKKSAESSLDAKGKASAQLAGLMGKRTGQDFLFVASLGDEKTGITALNANLVLDKDLNGAMKVESNDESEAAEHAKEANQHLEAMFAQIKGVLGDKGDALKNAAEKTKATVQGKTVNATISIPGTAVEKLLSKD